MNSTRERALMGESLIKLSLAAIQADTTMRYNFLLILSS